MIFAPKVKAGVHGNLQKSKMSILPEYCADFFHFRLTPYYDAPTIAPVHLLVPLPLTRVGGV